MISDETIESFDAEIWRWWESGHEDSLEFQEILHRFARAIYEQGRADRELEILRGFALFDSKDGAWLRDAIRNTGDLNEP